MNWFYANAGKQAGPVNETEFQRLAREGVIQPTTLVWREGMANWQPYSQVAPPLTAPPLFAPDISTPSPEAGKVVCRECGQLVPLEDTMQINGRTICAACKPIYVQKMREGAAGTFAPAAGEVRFAGFWIRLGAYMIDYLIQQILSIPLGLWVSTRIMRSIQPGAVNWNNLIFDYSLAFAAGFIMAVLYNWLFVAWWDATPGKLAVRIKIIRANGERPGYSMALWRSLANIVSSIPCGLGYLFVAFDKEKRALHDMMCNTRVVYK